jgi:hypothetical protein
MQAVRRAIVLGPLMAMIASLLGAGAVAAARPAPAPLASFTTPDAYEWTVPKGMKRVTFVLRGASGASVTVDATTGDGGAGGETRATLNVVPGQMFEIVVGGQGGTDGSGGFNGGGIGNLGGGGGGGSDIRAGACAATLSCDLSARVVVAGGGGAGHAGGYAGGAGGGLTGGVGGGPYGGGGGTQTSGGTAPADASPGSFGAGGDSGTYHFVGAGGGGGWYGGGGGAVGGGGGGSGFITALALSGTMQTGVWSGNGQILIYKG